MQQHPSGAGDKPSTKLNSPSFVNEKGTVMSEEEARMASAVAVPAWLQAMTEELNGIAGSLEILSTYAYRKGMDENLFTPDDVKNLEDIMATRDEDESESEPK